MNAMINDTLMRERQLLDKLYAALMSGRGILMARERLIRFYQALGMI